MWFKRKSEPHYEVTPYIAEFWNTLSNLPFILIGILRISTLEDAPDSLLLLYVLYIFCGVCSGFHHAIDKGWTLVVDWVPISLSILLNVWSGVYLCVDSVSAFKLLLSLVVLVTDHVWTPMKVPWGHVVWHLLAAFSIDSFYYTVYANPRDCVVD